MSQAYTQVDRAGFDIALVGDSAAMVVHGQETTLPMTLEEMIVHCRAVKRGVTRSFIVGDLPFGSYEAGASQALCSATRLVKEAGVDAVKLEGGGVSSVRAVRSIVEAGIAVTGHLGLTPQAVGVLGGFRPQGRTSKSALDIFEASLKLQEAGCMAIVLECVPKLLADAITSALSIPTIGIGAGNGTSGQVLVFHDLLGFLQHPHHAKVSPKFCKQYAHVGEDIQLALEQFSTEVSSKQFPDDTYTPYTFEDGELATFVQELDAAGYGRIVRILEEFKSS